MKQKIVKVETLKCQNCATRLEDILNTVDGLSAKVDFATKTAYIDSERDIDNEEVKYIIEFAGYTVSDIQ
ncbi:heavy-metal-associated domain-containing protein [Paludibacter sp. 221]|uniref:heavy-metal-associated domain-containing protein n=1 Tax=Paludibacter sp. 221 TaxID=2302939 RepID=UPI0013D79F6F|nr:heavy metal-associated domain-containing protein [Paludibacter sp. 221]